MSETATLFLTTIQTPVGDAESSYLVPKSQKMLEHEGPPSIVQSGSPQGDFLLEEAPEQVWLWDSPCREVGLVGAHSELSRIGVDKKSGRKIKSCPGRAVSLLE